MPISVTCVCGKKLRAKDELAGKRVACPECGLRFLVPVQEAPEPESYSLQDAPEPSPPPPTVPDNFEELDEDALPVAGAPLRKQRTVALSLEMTTTELDQRRNLHWLLIIAMIPLAISVVLPGKDRADLEERLKKTLEETSADSRDDIERLKHGHADLDEVIDALPEHKLLGAHLSRRSWQHWLYALVAALVFSGFLALIGSLERVPIRQLYYFGLFTATVGILFLMVVQVMAVVADIMPITDGAALIALWPFKFIAYSYRSATDPDASFAMSFFGFTLGVGFWEEMCKLAPILWVYRKPTPQAWRITMVWGLASGAGFGISEGISYSSSFYNGISGFGIYVVRFFSCVALHAVWTGSAALTLNRRQNLWRNVKTWHDYMAPLFIVIGMSVFLHGLYDTLLKKDYEALALLVAIASFGWFAWQNYERHQNDVAVERKALRIRQRHLRAAEG